MKIQYQDADLTVLESALYRTCSSIIEGEDYLLLIDPGFLPQEVAFIRAYVEKKTDKQLYIFFTHADYDHIAAGNSFTGAQHMASCTFASREKEDKQQTLEHLMRFDAEFYLQRPYPYAYPRVDIVLEDANAYHLGGKTTCFYYEFKGHTKDSGILFIPAMNLLIVGDYLSNIEPPYIDDDLGRYINSLNRLNNLIVEHRPRILLAGHGDMALNQEEIKRRLIRDLAYLQALEIGEEELCQQLLQEYFMRENAQAFHQHNLLAIKKGF